MDLEKLMALRAEKLTAMKDFNEAHAEMDEKQLAEFAKMKADFEKVSRDIDLAKTESKLANEVDDIVVTDTKNQNAGLEAVNALMTYARTGIVDAENSTTIGGGSNGAVLIPQEYASSILKELADKTAMRKFARVISTNGTYNMPIGGATPAFGWVDEGGTYPTPDLSFTNKSLEAFKAGGIILVSEELLNDESFDLVTHMREQIVEGISLAEGEAFIVGDGSKKPTGITVDITLDETVSALDTIALSDVEDVYLKVPAKARKQGSWIISDKFYKAIFRMKDSTGNYIMREGQNGMPGIIFGRPFEIDDTMDGATGETLAIFGKLNDYAIADRGDMAIQRLDERYADEGFVGFKVYKRTDGKLASAKNVAQLKNA